MNAYDQEQQQIIKRFRERTVLTGEYEDYVSFARQIRFAVSQNPRLEKQVREIWEDEIRF